MTCVGSKGDGPKTYTRASALTVRWSTCGRVFGYSISALRVWYEMVRVVGELWSSTAVAYLATDGYILLILLVLCCRVVENNNLVERFMLFWFFYNRNLLSGFIYHLYYSPVVHSRPSTDARQLSRRYNIVI